MDNNDLKNIEICVLVRKGDTVYTTTVAGGLATSFPIQGFNPNHLSFINLDAKTDEELVRKAMFTVTNVVLSSQPNYPDSLLEFGEKFLK
jgi:hypothetical protein